MNAKEKYHSLSRELRIGMRIAELREQIKQMERQYLFTTCRHEEWMLAARIEALEGEVERLMDSI